MLHLCELLFECILHLERIRWQEGKDFVLEVSLMPAIFCFGCPLGNESNVVTARLSILFSSSFGFNLIRCGYLAYNRVNLTWFGVAAIRELLGRTLSGYCQSFNLFGFWLKWVDYFSTGEANNLRTAKNVGSFVC